MQTARQLRPVPFYEDAVVLAGEDNEPLVAMKPIVINLGLDWKSQHSKVTERFNSVMVEITTTGGDGKQYAITYPPLRKLPAWLYSISPNEVKPELRDRIIRYQEQCDDALSTQSTARLSTTQSNVGCLKLLPRSKANEICPEAGQSCVFGFAMPLEELQKTICLAHKQGRPPPRWA